MDVYYFTEMPYAEFPESEAEKFPSMRLTFPNTYFDPRLAGELFRRYLDEYQYAEEVGFVGLMIDEHHNTPSCGDQKIAPSQRSPWDRGLVAGSPGGPDVTPDHHAVDRTPRP
jgi:hypothetical protein